MTGYTKWLLSGLRKGKFWTILRIVGISRFQYTLILSVRMCTQKQRWISQHILIYQFRSKVKLTDWRPSETFEALSHTWLTFLKTIHHVFQKMVRKCPNETRTYNRDWYSKSWFVNHASLDSLICSPMFKKIITVSTTEKWTELGVPKNVLWRKTSSSQNSWYSSTRHQYRSRTSYLIFQ